MQHPRLQGLAQDHAHSWGHSQSPDSEPWYRVPYDDAAQPAASGTHTAGQHQQQRSMTESSSQPQVAVRDSNVDFDVDVGWSDDEAAPPLPAESPPMPVSACCHLNMQRPHPELMCSLSWLAYLLLSTPEGHTSCHAGQKQQYTPHGLHIAGAAAAQI